MRQRVLDGKNKVEDFTRSAVLPKHKYAIGISNEIKKILNATKKNYPKRIEHESNAVSFHETEGGAVPTDALHIEVSNGGR